MVNVPLWLKSDRTRRIVCLVCFFLVEMFVFINLVMSSDHPTEALSWTTLSGSGFDVYLGLRAVRVCASGTCQSFAMTDLSEGQSCIDASGWVIASYVFVIVATIVPLFLLLSCGCVRVPYPKSIGLSATFIGWVWTIVAVSKWFEACHNVVYCKNENCSKKPGYAVALGILTIVVDLVGVLFYFWYTCRRQHPAAAGQGAAKSGAMIDSAAEASDGYAASPAGGQFGGYTTPGSTIPYAMGVQALSNPAVQQFGMAAASNPHVQQWGAQQVQQSYGYGGYK